MDAALHLVHAHPRPRRAMVGRRARERSSMLTSPCSRLRDAARGGCDDSLGAVVWRRGVARPDGGAKLRSTVNRSHASWKTTAVPRLAGRLHACRPTVRAASVSKTLANDPMRQDRPTNYYRTPSRPSPRIATKSAAANVPSAANDATGRENAAG